MDRVRRALEERQGRAADAEEDARMEEALEQLQAEMQLLDDAEAREERERTAQHELSAWHADCSHGARTTRNTFAHTPSLGGSAVDPCRLRAFATRTSPKTNQTFILGPRPSTQGRS